MLKKLSKKWMSNCLYLKVMFYKHRHCYIRTNIWHFYLFFMIYSVCAEFLLCCYSVWWLSMWYQCDVRTDNLLMSKREMLWILKFSETRLCDLRVYVVLTENVMVKWLIVMCLTLECTISLMTSTLISQYYTIGHHSNKKPLQRLGYGNTVPIPSSS